MTGPEPAQDSPLDGLPVVPHVLRAWRVFVVDGGRLRSVHYYGPNYGWWEVGEWQRARCPSFGEGPVSTTTFAMLYWGQFPYVPPGVPIPHEAPHAKCGCGIYATSAEQLVDWLATDEPIAVARVELAGRIVECEKGYRAERARVVRYWPAWYWAERMARTVFAGHPSWERWRQDRRQCWHCGMPYVPMKWFPFCPAHGEGKLCHSCGRNVEPANNGCWWRKGWPHLVQQVA